MQQAIVEQGASLLPIAGHHHCQRACFRSGRCNSHGVVEILHKMVLEEPVACLAQPGLAAHLIDLQVELSLFVCRFCLHDMCPFFWVGCYELTALRHRIFQRNECAQPAIAQVKPKPEQHA